MIVILAFLEGDWENGVWLFTASVAVAASDTFASEIGCMDKRVRMITTFKKCARCAGQGSEPGSKPVTCGYCNGHGKVRSKQFGRVEIPQEAFIGVLKINKE